MGVKTWKPLSLQGVTAFHAFRRGYCRHGHEHRPSLANSLGKPVFTAVRCQPSRKICIGVSVSPECHAVLLDFRLQAFSCRYYSQSSLGHTPDLGWTREVKDFTRNGLTVRGASCSRQVLQFLHRPRSHLLLQCQVTTLDAPSTTHTVCRL